MPANNSWMPREFDDVFLDEALPLDDVGKAETDSIVWHGGSERPVHCHRMAAAHIRDGQRQILANRPNNSMYLDGVS